MGWIWPFSSSASSDEVKTQSSNNGAEQTSTTSGVALTEEQRMRIFGRPGPAVAPRPQTQEEKADAELEALIQSFAAETNDTKTSKDSSAEKPSKKPEPIPEPEPSRILPDGSLNISPEAMYPRTMSCRQQFDQAFYCQSLGGKFNDIYRYGKLNSCSEQWGAFWFCMRIRTLPEEQKAKEIKQFYKDRDERRKKEWGSSEDVWEVRNVAVDRAFWKDPDRDDDQGAVKVKE